MKQILRENMQFNVKFNTQAGRVYAACNKYDKQNMNMINIITLISIAVCQKICFGTCSPGQVSAAHFAPGSFFSLEEETVSCHDCRSSGSLSLSGCSCSGSSYCSCLHSCSVFEEESWTLSSPSPSPLSARGRHLYVTTR